MGCNLGHSPRLPCGLSMVYCLSVCSAPAILTPVSGSSSSSSDKYAVFKQLSVEQPPEPSQPVSGTHPPGPTTHLNYSLLIRSSSTTTNTCVGNRHCSCCLS